MRYVLVSFATIMLVGCVGNYDNTRQDNANQERFEKHCKHAHGSDSVLCKRW